MIQSFASGRNSMLCARSAGAARSGARAAAATMERMDTDRSPGERITNASQCNRLRTRCGRLCQPGEGRACDAHDAPGLQHDCATATVEVDGGRVPVEDIPLHAGATALHCDGGNVGEKRLADTTSAMRRLHEEVFQMNAGTAPGGVDGEVERKACGFTLVVGDEALEERLWSEAVAAQLRLADLDRIGLALVRSEGVDQGEDGGYVGFLGEADVHGGWSRQRVYGSGRPGK